MQRNSTERPSAEDLLQHPFIVNAVSQAEPTIRTLSQKTAPLLAEQRKRAKEREEEVGGNTLRSGTVLRVDTQTGTVIFGDGDGEDGDPYSTVHFTPSRNGTTVNTGSVVFNP